MGNNRGTKYSAVYQGGAVTDTDENYWNWSWGEMGTLDVPAFITEILEITEAPKVTYIGYGQGNTQIFYGLTQRQDDFYLTKLDKVIALAPCVF